MYFQSCKKTPASVIKIYILPKIKRNLEHTLITLKSFNEPNKCFHLRKKVWKMNEEIRRQKRRGEIIYFN